VHGWPELSISWRHQLPCFASLGFRAIAPDMRGYGRSSVYPKHEDYALANTVHNMVDSAICRAIRATSRRTSGRCVRRPLAEQSSRGSSLFFSLGHVAKTGDHSMSTDTALTVPTRFVEADGIRFAYRRWGQSGGVPLVFLNYFSGNLDPKQA
jgi:hypothetical protein